MAFSAGLVRRRALHRIYGHNDDGSGFAGSAPLWLRAPFDIARTSFAELGARVSPDSRWVAYESNETGRLEIYVQPFPGPGPKEQISAGGGRMARWRPDRGELSYVAPDRRLMAVSVARSASNILNSGTRHQVERRRRATCHRISLHRSCRSRSCCWSR